MSVSIGGFTAKHLTLQPYGYEGEARYGLTAQLWVTSGLLTAGEWQSLLSVYNTWRNQRINDPDTLASQTVGTTVAVTAKSNGLTWNNVACWFAEAPQSEQVGHYVQAQVTLVDAAQALQVLLKQRDKSTESDCASITADLNKRKADRDCELAALEGGLADSFAVQDLRGERIDVVAKQTAYAGDAAQLQAIKAAGAKIELLEKTADLAGRAADAQGIAEIDLDIEAQSVAAQAAAYAAKGAVLDALEADRLKMELLTSQSKEKAYSPIATLDALKATREMLSLYEAYINDTGPVIGNVTVGGVTIALVKPMETRQDGPSLSMTATGATYVTGPLAAHKVRQIEGYITAGTYDGLLSWYDATVQAGVSAGQWFPVGSPSATVEPFLVAGAKGTRYSVTLTLVQAI